jgi:putative redox protein
MPEIQVDYLSDVQFKIRARRHVIMSDQPIENGGQDAGATPPELLLAALGSCAGYYAVQYLKVHGLAVEGTRISTSAAKLTAPARLDNFMICVESTITLSENHRRGIQQAVQHCLIHNTLLRSPQISVKVGSNAADRPSKKE